MYIINTDFIYYIIVYMYNIGLYDVVIDDWLSSLKRGFSRLILYNIIIEEKKPKYFTLNYII